MDTLGERIDRILSEATGSLGLTSSLGDVLEAVREGAVAAYVDLQATSAREAIRAGMVRDVRALQIPGLDAEALVGAAMAEEYSYQMLICGSECPCCGADRDEPLL